jgi:CHAT domain-containing protein
MEYHYGSTLAELCMKNHTAKLRKRILVTAATGCVLFGVTTATLFFYRIINRPRPGTPEAMLQAADERAWLNDWEGAAPLYRLAEQSFVNQHKAAEALYARVSQIPANSGSTNLQELIWTLSQDLTLPEARQNPETRLRILTVRGIIETNYDAAMARSTWASVEQLARSQHHYLLSSRASGEKGIAAFMLGDATRARNQVIRAAAVAKLFRDSAAIVRYTSVYGAGLIKFGRYNEALGYLDSAIKRANSTAGMAYPSIAVNSKIDALAKLQRYQEALELCSVAIQNAKAHQRVGSLYALLESRAEVHQQINDWPKAIYDYEAAIVNAKKIGFWRGLMEADGPLARAYEHEGQLQLALSTINDGISASLRIPDELFFVPRNLAIKADILRRLGRMQASNDLFQKSADLIDLLLSAVPTPQTERLLITELSTVYSEFFSSLCEQGRYGGAFGIIEKERGRIEGQSLEHIQALPPHPQTPAERELTRLNLQLINAEDPEARAQIDRAIYAVEQRLDDSSMTGRTALNPVPLHLLQAQLQPSELLVEYVLDKPHSYALAITANSVKRYTLPDRNTIEQHAEQYRKMIGNRTEDKALAQTLFRELLAPIGDYKENSSLIIVPDGELHLLPFSALIDGAQQYVLASHRCSFVPSATVLHLLRNREEELLRSASNTLPYVGVAAWTKTFKSNNSILPFMATWMRAFDSKRATSPEVTGPQRSQLVALPESKHEIESIAEDLPKPRELLLGEDATETHFKKLPLSKYNVLHLALHGYADNEFPDRSALVFAPQPQGVDDGLLQVREIRRLHLNANLVTLSACNTGVGPVGAAGVANLVGAFVQAGAESVVSTLWELEDHFTARLMKTFYDHLAHHEQKAEALRQAQLALQNAGASPYYWASFELVGNPTGTIATSALMATN